MGVRAKATRAGKTWLWTELLVLFVGLPGLLWFARIQGARFPIVPMLLVITAGFGVSLLRDPYFDRRVFRAWRGAKREWRRITATFAASAVFLSAWVVLSMPESLFELARRDPLLWGAILLLYPVLSVYPQELIYRAFFCHRYSRLFGRRWQLIGTSAAVFGFVHILYGSWISVGLTTVGGALFCLTYLRTRSVLLVGLEHALYGCFLFTIGLGRYFYDAV